MRLFILTPAAQQDVDDIADRIGADNPAAAMHVLERLESALTLLGDNPHAGRERRDLDPKDPVRAWCVYSYLILYRPDRRPIEVVRIIHGAQDLESAVEPPKAARPRKKRRK